MHHTRAPEIRWTGSWRYPAGPAENVKYECRRRESYFEERVRSLLLYSVITNPGLVFKYAVLWWNVAIGTPNYSLYMFNLSSAMKKKTRISPGNDSNGPARLKEEIPNFHTLRWFASRFSLVWIDVRIQNVQIQNVQIRNVQIQNVQIQNRI